MKRFIIAALILLIIIVINILEINMLKNAINPIISDINQAQSEIKSGQYKNAEKTSSEIEKQWLKTENKLSLFINHRTVSDIGLNISRLTSLSSPESENDFLAECNAILVMLIHIKNNEHPSISNLL